MNAVSEIDAKKSKKAEQAEILIGDDWEDGEDLVKHEEERARGLSGWISLNSSPLARKIITFNLLALVVLVGGVLYLSQSRDGLVKQREAALIVQAQLIAKVFEAKLPASGPVNLAAGDGVSPTDILKTLNLPAGIEVYVFDATKNQVGSSVGLRRAGSQPAVPVNPDAGRNFITAFLNNTWAFVSAYFAPDSAEPAGRTAEELALGTVGPALEGKISSRSYFEASDEQLFSVAAPIARNGQILGALVLSTTAGEISQIVRAEREQVLQMFVVAILEIGRASCRERV